MAVRVPASEETLLEQALYSTDIRPAPIDGDPKRRQLYNRCSWCASGRSGFHAVSIRTHFFLRYDRHHRI